MKRGKAMAVAWQSTALTTQRVGRSQGGVGGGHHVKAAGPGGKNQALTPQSQPKQQPQLYSLPSLSCHRTTRIIIYNVSGVGN